MLNRCYFVLLCLLDLRIHSSFCPPFQAIQPHDVVSAMDDAQTILEVCEKLTLGVYIWAHRLAKGKMGRGVLAMALCKHCDSTPTTYVFGLKQSANR